MQTYAKINVKKTEKITLAKAQQIWENRHYTGKLNSENTYTLLTLENGTSYLFDTPLPEGEIIAAAMFVVRPEDLKDPETIDPIKPM